MQIFSQARANKISLPFGKGTQQTEQSLGGISNRNVRSNKLNFENMECPTLQKQKSSHMQTSFGEDITNKHMRQVDFEQNGSEIEKQNASPTRQIKEVKNMLSSSSTIPGSTEPITVDLTVADYQVLAPLKQCYNTDYLQKLIKNRTFDFNIEFYGEALGLIRALGYQQSPDYSYLEEKYETCRLIIALVELHTKPADLEKQETVKLNFTQCKRLYRKFDQRKTSAIVKKYIKMQGECLNYRMGKLGLQAGIDKKLIQRSIKNNKFGEIVIALYIISCLGQMENIRKTVQNVADFVRMLEKLIKKKIKVSTETIQYFPIAIKIIELGLLCCEEQDYLPLKSAHSKLKAFQKDLSLPCPSASIIPSYYLTFFIQFVINNQKVNPSALQQMMVDFMEQHPICTVCFSAIDFNTDSFERKNNRNYCHAECEKFLKLVEQSATDNN